MAVAEVNVFLIIGTLVNELLDISDIMSRLFTCKHVYDKPTEAAESLLMFTDLKLHWNPFVQRIAWNPLIKRLLEHSRPLIPLTMDRAKEILAIHPSLWDFAEDEGILARLEAGEIDDFMFQSVGGEDAPWDNVMEKMRQCVWDNPAGCSLNGMEFHRDLLLLDYEPDP